MCVLSLHHKLDEVGNQVCNRFSTVLIVDIFWCGNYTMSEVSDKLYSICEIYYSLDICLNFTSPSNGWSAVTFLVVAMRKCFWFLHLTPSLCSRDLLSPPSPHVRNVIICFIWSRYSQDHPVSDDSHDLLLSSHSLSMIQTRGINNLQGNPTRSSNLSQETHLVCEEALCESSWYQAGTYVLCCWYLST